MFQKKIFSNQVINIKENQYSQHRRNNSSDLPRSTSHNKERVQIEKKGKEENSFQYYQTYTNCIRENSIHKRSTFKMKTGNFYLHLKNRLQDENILAKKIEKLNLQPIHKYIPRRPSLKRHTRMIKTLLANTKFENEEKTVKEKRREAFVVVKPFSEMLRKAKGNILQKKIISFVINRESIVEKLKDQIEGIISNLNVLANFKVHSKKLYDELQKTFSKTEIV